MVLCYARSAEKLHRDGRHGMIDEELLMGEQNG